LRIPLFTLLGVEVPGGKKLSGLKMTAHIARVVDRKCEESGLDRIVFAKKIGVSVPQLYIMLDGRSSPMLLVADALATRLGVTLWQLLGVSPIEEKR
jgi:transcriptional regulator with XRE-family HTH domain